MRETDVQIGNSRLDLTTRVKHVCRKEPSCNLFLPNTLICLPAPYAAVIFV